MLRQGPIPAIVHGGIEYAVGVLLIIAPFLLTFTDDYATTASLVSGVLLLAFTAASDLPTGLVKGVPPAVHVVCDVVLALLFIALPFILAFRDETAPTAMFIALGVAHLLVTIGTRFPESAPARQK